MTREEEGGEASIIEIRVGLLVGSVDYGENERR